MSSAVERAIALSAKRAEKPHAHVFDLRRDAGLDRGDLANDAAEAMALMTGATIRDCLKEVETWTDEGLFEYVEDNKARVEEIR